MGRNIRFHEFSLDGKQKVKYHHLISTRCRRYLWASPDGMRPSELYAKLGWAGMLWDEPGGVGIAGIADIARNRRDRTSKNLNHKGHGGTQR